MAISIQPWQQVIARARAVSSDNSKLIGDFLFVSRAHDHAHHRGRPLPGGDISNFLLVRMLSARNFQTLLWSSPGRTLCETYVVWMPAHAPRGLINGSFEESNAGPVTKTTDLAAVADAPGGGRR